MHIYTMRSQKRTKFQKKTNNSESARKCDAKNCSRDGQFRAPRSRAHLHQYYWFCLQHVRQYNASWNYYEGMDDEEIEIVIRNESLGFRPTRPFSDIDKENVRDRERVILESLRQFMYFRAYRAKHQYQRTSHADDVEKRLKQPLTILGLKWPVTFEQLRARYYRLVKIYHPDRNHTKAKDQEYIKNINAAFSTIKTHLQNETKTHFS